MRQVSPAGVDVCFHTHLACISCPHAPWVQTVFPSPGQLLNQGIKPVSPVLAGRFFNTESLAASYMGIFRL